MIFTTEDYGDIALTLRIVEIMIQKYAEGQPPYLLSVPRAALAAFVSDNPNPSLIRISAIAGRKNDDLSPTDEAYLFFPFRVVSIIYRRCLAEDFSISCS